MKFVLHLWLHVFIRDAAGGEEEDGREGGDAVQQAEEGGPQLRSGRLPPLLDVWDVEDAGRCSPGLPEHLLMERSFIF